MATQQCCMCQSLVVCIVIPCQSCLVDRQSSVVTNGSWHNIHILPWRHALCQFSRWCDSICGRWHRARSTGGVTDQCLWEMALCRLNRCLWGTAQCQLNRQCDRPVSVQVAQWTHLHMASVVQHMHFLSKGILPGLHQQSVSLFHLTLFPPQLISVPCFCYSHCVHPCMCVCVSPYYTLCKLFW